MKKTLQLTGLAVLAFILGLVGTYYLLPQVNPSRISGLAAEDSASQATVDSLIRARMEQQREDSIAAVEAAALDIVGLTPDSLDTLRYLANRTSTLRDSLTELSDSLGSTTEQLATLNDRVDELEEQANVAGKYDQKAEEISNAFTEMADDEMQQVLEHTRPKVLQKIYTKASGRDRSRILRALSPKLAARFMEAMTDPSTPIDSIKAGTSLARDSTGPATAPGAQNPNNRR